MEYEVCGAGLLVKLKLIISALIDVPPQTCEGARYCHYRPHLTAMVSRPKSPSKAKSFAG